MRAIIMFVLLSLCAILVAVNNIHGKENKTFTMEPITITVDPVDQVLEQVKKEEKTNAIQTIISKIKVQRIIKKMTISDANANECVNDVIHSVPLIQE